MDKDLVDMLGKIMREYKEKNGIKDLFFNFCDTKEKFFNTERDIVETIISHNYKGDPNETYEKLIKLYNQFILLLKDIQKELTEKN